MKVQDQGISLAISLIGIKFGVFDYLYKNPSTEADIIKSLQFDSSYIKKWILAAEGYRLLVRNNDLIMLSELGEVYSSKCSNSQIANLIQGVFSVLIAHEAMPCLESGERPGYEIVNKFENIKPWFDYTNGQKNLPIVDEMLRQPIVMNFFSDVRGNVADFACGNGWFLSKIGSHLESMKLYGVTDNPDIENGLLRTSHNEFLESEISYDLVVLNKVLHHVWMDEEIVNNIVSKLSDIGKIFVWEFNWDSVLLKVEDHKEVAFLNFVEHIQGAEYLPTDLVISRFGKYGFSCSTVNVDEDNQILYLFSK